MRVFKLSSKKITNFKNTFLINNYLEVKKYLGPHGSCIFYELTEAIKYNNYLTIIILSATLLDVIKNEKTDIINSLSGIEINSIFSSYEAMWLRQTRNSIVHYEKPIDGLLGNKEDNKILEEYSVKTITVLSKIINEILKLK